MVKKMTDKKSKKEEESNKKFNFPKGLIPVDPAVRIFLNAEGELFVLERDLSGEFMLVKEPIMYPKK